jgi:hypothetical protein
LEDYNNEGGSDYRKPEGRRVMKTMTKVVKMVKVMKMKVMGVMQILGRMMNMVVMTVQMVMETTRMGIEMSQDLKVMMMRLDIKADPNSVNGGSL